MNEKKEKKKRSRISKIKFTLSQENQLVFIKDMIILNEGSKFTRKTPYSELEISSVAKSGMMEKVILEWLEERRKAREFI